MLGAGGWGTALSVHLARLGHGVRLWARDPSLAAQLEAHRVNASYLPAIEFPASLRVTSDLAEALRDTEHVLAALPSHGTRDILRRAAPHVPAGAIVVSATKGLEGGTLFRPSEIIHQELGDVRFGVLSGPSFAVEVARELPTAVSLPHVIADGSVTPGQHASFLGKKHDPLLVLQDPNSPSFALPELNLPDGVTFERMQARRECCDRESSGVVRASISDVVDPHNCVWFCDNSDRSEWSFCDLSK